MMMMIRTSDISLQAQRFWKRALSMARSSFRRRCDPQSKCAKCARQILYILRQFHTNNISYSLCDLHNDTAKETHEKIYKILNTLDPDGVAESSSNFSDLLDIHKCNRFACLILEEAITSYEEYNKNELDKMVLTSIERSVMESLEYILEDLRSERYSSKGACAEMDKKLDMFELKFKGYGVEYLKKLAQSRTY
jgi:hypothetical protein